MGKHGRLSGAQQLFVDCKLGNSISAQLALRRLGTSSQGMKERVLKGVAGVVLIGLVSAVALIGSATLRPHAPATARLDPGAVSLLQVNTARLRSQGWSRRGAARPPVY